MKQSDDLGAQPNEKGQPMGVAWCWRSGLVEVGPAGAVPDGAITIARGPAVNLAMVLGVLCRHGQGDSANQLLVPGVPDEGDDNAACDALSAWLAWAAKGNGHAGRHGVVFAQEGRPL